MTRQATAPPRSKNINYSSSQVMWPTIRYPSHFFTLTISSKNPLFRFPYDLVQSLPISHPQPHLCTLSLPLLLKTSNRTARSQRSQERKHLIDGLHYVNQLWYNAHLKISNTDTPTGTTQLRQTMDTKIYAPNLDHNKPCFCKMAIYSTVTTFHGFDHITTNPLVP